MTANSEQADREVYVQWDTPRSASFCDVAGYNLYRQETGGVWKKITAAPLQATAFVDSGLAFGKGYSYRLTAVDGSGNESKPSAEVAVALKKPTTKPKTPVAVEAVVLEGDLVRLTWDNPSLADAARVMGFHVFRRVAGSGEFQKLTVRPTVYHTYYDEVKNAGLADKYEYAVLAVDAFGNQSLQSVSSKPKPPVAE